MVCLLYHNLLYMPGRVYKNKQEKAEKKNLYIVFQYTLVAGMQYRVYSHTHVGL